MFIIIHAVVAPPLRTKRKLTLLFVVKSHGNVITIRFDTKEFASLIMKGGNLPWSFLKSFRTLKWITDFATFRDVFGETILTKTMKSKIDIQTFKFQILNSTQHKVGPLIISWIKKAVNQSLKRTPIQLKLRKVVLLNNEFSHSNISSMNYKFPCQERKNLYIQYFISTPGFQAGSK